MGVGGDGLWGLGSTSQEPETRLAHARHRTRPSVQRLRQAEPPGGADLVSGRREWPWLLTGPAALLLLLFASRGAPLGIPVADDYTFLATLLFEHPLDFLSPMGSPLYWRPISRQLYFLILGPSLIRHPWVAAATHCFILLLLFFVIYRVSRRAFGPPVAAAIASFPLLGEPSRVLLAWPSGGEYLLAMLGSALAIHEVLTGRLVTAGVAACAAVLSHEAAHLVLVALPIVAWTRERRWRSALPWVAMVLGIGAVSALGHSIARARGMGLPSDQQQVPWPALPGTFSGTIAAQFNLETLSDPLRLVIIGGYAILLIVMLALLSRRATRIRLSKSAPILAGAIAWFGVGLLPLALLFPGWNGWRTAFPGLGLGVVVSGLLGGASPLLAIGVAGLRAVALCGAVAAPAVVDVRPPPSASDLSFVRLVRLQRTVESTRLALAERYPSLPRGGEVRYWLVPALTLYGFEGPRAVRVWYRDPGLRWEAFQGARDMRRMGDALVEYSTPRAMPATVIEPHAVHLFADALEAMDSRHFGLADSLLGAAFDAQPRISEPLCSSLAHNQAVAALALGDLERADSLNSLDLAWAGESARHSLITARLASARRDPGGAESALRRCLMLDPEYAEAVALARELGLLPKDSSGRTAPSPGRASPAR